MVHYLLLYLLIFLETITLLMLATKLVKRRKTETKLRDIEKYSDLLFHQSPIGLALCDINGNVVDLNKAACRTIGYTIEETLALSYWDLTPKKYADQEALQLKSLQEKGCYGPYEKEYIHKNGSLIPVRLSGMIIQKEGLPYIWSSVEDITAQKKYEKKIKDERNYTQTVLNTAHAVIVTIDQSGGIVNINKAGCVITGKKRDEILHKSFFDVFSRGEEKQKIERAFQKLQKCGYSSYESSFSNQEGQQTQMAWSNAVLEEDSQYICTGIDITKNKEMQLALLESQQEWEWTFGSVPDSIMVLDQSGTIKRINENMAKCYQKERTELLEKNIHQLLPENEKATLLFPVKNLKNIESQEHFEVYDEAESIHYSIDIVPRYNPIGRQNGIIQIIRDITAEKELEEQRHRIAIQIEQAQKLESLGVLSGGIAHDFNNLLTAITASASLALYQIPTESPWREHFHRIEKAAERAAKLCDQLLAYSGHGQFDISPMQINHLILEMNSLLQLTLSKDSCISYNLDRGLPNIEADESQISQILMNLITNASESLEGKCGDISIRTGTISKQVLPSEQCRFIEYPLSDQYIFVEVTDNGSGMDLQTEKRIFDPFFTTKFTGRGLGLSAIQGIIQGHNGGLKVQTKQGEGSSFTVYLPASVKELDQSEIQHNKPSIKTPLTGKVLIIEDEKLLREMSTEILEFLGFEVLTAPEGQQGILLYREMHSELVLVLLDMTMPGKNGREIFEILQIIDGSIPILMTSGYSKAEIYQQFQETQFAGFVKKPFTLSSLANAVKKVCQNTEKELAE